MAAQQRPEPGTDVAVADSRAIGKLPPDLQNALALRKMRNQIAGQLAGTNWGKGMDLETRRAVADWGQQFRVDVTTEIHVLGGNVYLNAAFYLRQLSELIAAGLVEYAFADHIEDDKRLKALGAEGEGEYSRRLRERIMRGVPDAAVSAVVFRVKLRSMDKEVTGCKWTGGGTRKNDPVGEAFPVESAESRAARRCLRQLASHVPQRTADELERIKGSADILTERVSSARTAAAISEASLRKAPALMAGADPYWQRPSEEKPVPIDVTVPSSSAPVRSAATAGDDPFADDEPAPTGASSQSADTRLSDALAFPLPFAQGDAKKGVELEHVTTKDLQDALRFADGQQKWAGFCEAAVTVLESRVEA